MLAAVLVHDGAACGAVTLPSHFEAPHIPFLFVQRKFYQKTERVKAVDIHPTEPWILTSLYSGHVVIWNYATQVAVKSFEVTELPIRAGKFIPRKQWIVTGSDDMMIRAYNVNTQERVTEIHGAVVVFIGVRVCHPLVSASVPDDSPWAVRRRRSN